MSCLWLFSLATIGLTLSHIEEVEARDFSWPSVEGICAQSLDTNVPIAKSGVVEWSVAESEAFLKKYRAWLHWETSAPQPLNTLENRSALRRIMINAIEREVIVRYASKFSAKASTPLTDQMLRAWLIEMVPGTMRPTEKGLDDFVRGRLKMRAEADLSFFWEAARDAYWVQSFKGQLVDALRESDAEKEWKRQGLLMRTWLLQVPRVPTTEEISRAASTHKQAIKAYYQAHLELFSQPLRLLAKPYWVKGGRLEAHRLELISIREALVGGATLEDVHESHPLLVKGGSRTLRGRSIPSKTEVKEGAYTPVRLTRKGWTFYRISRVYPAYVRSLKERSVQREVAAAVLRERDELPRARGLATRAHTLLKTGKSLVELKPWARKNRVRLSSPDPFFRSQQDIVPTIGLAPELNEAIFNLEDGEVSEPIVVRQHYVIAKIVEKSQQSVAWSDVRTDFMDNWRVRRAPQVLDEWLTDHLKESPRWVSTEQLKFFRADELRFESSLEALNKAR